MVRWVGLEPTRLAAHGPQPCLSTNSSPSARRIESEQAIDIAAARRRSSPDLRYYSERPGGVNGTSRTAPTRHLPPESSTANGGEADLGGTHAPWLTDADRLGCGGERFRAGAGHR